METKLTGQAAINFAKQNDVALYANADSHYTVPTPRSRFVTDTEAQVMVNEGLVVWCWTDAEAEAVEYNDAIDYRDDWNSDDEAVHAEEGAAIDEENLEPEVEIIATSWELY